MIDIDVSERVCDDLIEHGLGYLPPAGIGNSVSIKELITSLRQAEKDAARYRWLRESASTENHGGLAYDFRLVDAIRYMPGATPNETMGIDDAIDEAMQCNK